MEKGSRVGTSCGPSTIYFMAAVGQLSCGRACTRTAHAAPDAERSHETLHSLLPIPNAGQ